MNSASYPTIECILASIPPPHLYHYTSPAGLIGIVQTKKLWATHVRFMNDLKELQHAVDCVRHVIDLRLNAPAHRGYYSASERELLQEMASIGGSSGRGVFVTSLTAMRDQLSRWRAYCPPAGGYAIGFPSRQLTAMAAVQGYYLTPCVYDGETQFKIADELVYHYLNEFRCRAKEGQELAQVRHDIVYRFIHEMPRYGPILKHRSFHEEQEWRLVSPLYHIGDSKISYRTGRNTIIPYCEFSLTNQEYPNLTDPEDHKNSLEVVIGSTSDFVAAQYAVQSILLAHIGQGCWHGRSEAPYSGM